MSSTFVRNRAAGALALGLFLAAAPACRTVRYDDPDKVETLTTDYGSTDLQTIASAMVDSLLRHPAIAQADRPVLFFGGIENATSEHVDTKAIADTIRTSLVKSGRVRFTADRAAQDAIQEQIQFQSGSYVDPATAKRIGKQIGADLVLTGRFASIVKRAGSRKDVYYLFTLSLENIETGLLEWTDQKEIRKGESKALLGW